MHKKDAGAGQSRERAAPSVLRKLAVADKNCADFQEYPFIVLEILCRI